ITEPGRLRICLPVETAEFNRIREDAEQESAAARRTRHELQKTVSAHYEGQPLRRVLEDLGQKAGPRGEPVHVIQDDLSPALSNKAGGPVAVKPGGDPRNLQPQAQHYLVYIDILDADDAITPGNLAQVKVHCKPETCAHWAWRKINSLLDLGLM